MSGVVTPALTPSLTDDIIDTYENFQGAETIDGMVNLFVPPELMQHRSSTPYYHFMLVILQIK